jgi:hypothetical protein
MKICECFKLLKVGMFVKIPSDAIIGEIGVIEGDELFIFTNSMDGCCGTHRHDMRDAAQKKGYKTAWCAKSICDDEIEILDSLPDEMKSKLKDEPCASIEAYEIKCSWNDDVCDTWPSACGKRKRRIAETLKQLDELIEKADIFQRTLPIHIGIRREETNLIILKTIAKNLHSLLDCENDCDDDEDCDTCCDDDEE